MLDRIFVALPMLFSVCGDRAGATIRPRLAINYQATNVAIRRGGAWTATGVRKHLARV
jgi:hypothetical protein